MPLNNKQTIGRLMIDFAGTQLTQDDIELLARPSVGGVILFTRNFVSSAQLSELIRSIRAVKPDCLIAVDHEGGRVQRFKAPFTHLPAMAKFGLLYQQNKGQALMLAKDSAWLLASELRCFDIDISFTPVLDLEYGVSSVIGDRSFSTDQASLIALANSFIAGMLEAGMASTGKHFPGHGGVAADSHVALPVDSRSQVEIANNDLYVFKQVMNTHLDAVMPAHVIYAQADDKPAGFSSYWLQTVLRQGLGFDGVIFSDDLSMEGASVAGDFAGRAEAALSAGCDMILVCNHRQGALAAADFLEASASKYKSSVVQTRLAGMLANTKHSQCLDEFQSGPRAKAVISALQASSFI